MTPSYDELLRALEREGGELLAAGDNNLDVEVPSCPGWSMRDLLLHVGDVHSWVAGIVRDRAKQGRRREAAPPTVDALQYAVAARDAVLEALRNADPDDEVWNWADQPPRVAFWARRMAHETSMHRWDAQNCHGNAKPIDAEFAVDGIDEALRVTLAARLRHKPQHRIAGTLHLHATDVAGEWLVTIAPESLDVRNEHGKGDVALRGDASDLLLVLYNREPSSAVDIIGDRSLLDRWREGVRF